MAEHIDLLIEPRWLLPVEPTGLVLEDHAVAIRDGRILAVLPRDEARARYHPADLEVLDQHVLLPGLVNLHTHAAMTLLRGIADDLPLMDWLQNHIWPTESQFMSPAFVRDGTLLACAEMLRGGITCGNDMYFYPDAAIEAALAAGIRLVAGITTLEFPTPYAADAQDYLSKGLAIRDRFRGEELISFTLAPHAPYTVSDATFGHILTLSEQLELPIHTHLHETAAEIEGSLKEHGVRPLLRLQRLGLLSPNLIAIHAVHLDNQDIELLARHGCSVGHCPSSNLKLASGIAPVAALQQAGVNVGLGTDGAASNNRLDGWAEMRLAALLAKGSTGDATRVAAHAALAMATLNGARALGKEREIGSIVAGKFADLCAVRLDHLELEPCYDIASHLVYAAGREHVTHTWVGGRMRVADGELVDLDRDELLQRARAWQYKIRPSSGT